MLVQSAQKFEWSLRDVFGNNWKRLTSTLHSISFVSILTLALLYVPLNYQHASLSLLCVQIISFNDINITLGITVNIKCIVTKSTWIRSAIIRHDRVLNSSYFNYSKCLEIT